jgi:circadian clock protein KaiC
MPRLDALLGGGFPIGRAVLVCGAAGVGKTTFALQFLHAGIGAGERGILALVDEKPTHIIEDAHAFGWDLAEWTRHKQLLMLDASPFFSALGKSRALDARQVASDLAAQVKGFGAKRLVIDPITSLVPSDVTPDAAREFLRALMFSMQDNLACTTLLIAPDARGENRTTLVEHLASGVIELAYKPVADRLMRTLTIRKMRGTPIEPTELSIRIDQRIGIIEGGSNE